MLLLRVSDVLLTCAALAATLLIAMATITLEDRLSRPFVEVIGYFGFVARMKVLAKRLTISLACASPSLFSQAGVVEPSDSIE